MRIRILTLWTMIALAAWLLPGCTESPDDANWTNPLDPDGPFAGDPFQVSANFSGGSVFITWTGIVNSSLAGYEVLHTLEEGGLFSVLTTTEPDFTTYEHVDFAPNQPNYYKVRAVDAQGNASAISNVTEASITPPTDLQIGETATTSTRTVELSIRSSSGETAEVDSLADFSTSSSYDLDEEFTAVVSWDLGTASANEEWKHVYVRIHDGGVATTARHDSVQVSFAPALAFEDNPTTLASRTTPLAVGGSGGVVEMRFAPDRDQLALETPVAGDTIYAGYELSAEPDTQLVFGEFWCDFGFSVVDSTFAYPDSLAVLELTLNNNSPTVSEMGIPVTTDLQAAEMRFAQDPMALATSPWLPYERIGSMTHDGCASDLTKTVYAEFRNDWFHPAPVTATIIWAPPEVLGAVLESPSEVTSASTVTLTGTAQTGTCDDPLDLVEVNTGSGWVAATGLEDWTLEWTAPTVTEVTTVTITLRASAGAATSAETEFTIEVAPVEPARSR